VRILACVALLVAALAAPRGATAMTMEIRGDQIVLSGRIVPEDAAQFRELIGTHPEVKTVVLTDSPGGAAAANDAMTNVIEAQGLNTVVAGYCVSACAMVFLAGKDRAFGDLQPLARTSLGFHASYARGGSLASDRRLAALKARVLDRTGGKIDPALVDRWLHLTDERSTVRFRYPAPGESAPETYFCAIGRDANRGDYHGCESIANTDALTSGIITSTQIVHVNR
jgi:hypothetical protein